MANEKAIVFECEKAELLGILHEVNHASDVGVIIVVAGGPQYRVGVSRQFVMLGRTLADRGFPVLRFDHRGVGDSGGTYRGYADMGADIESAIDALQKEYPSVTSVALWGECESATAIAFYAHADVRVKGLVLVNPWIRTEEGQAKTYLKHYYLSRLVDQRLWIKVLTGKFDFLASLSSLVGFAKLAVVTTTGPKVADQMGQNKLSLPQELEQSMCQFGGRIHLVTSGKDYIAQEFKDYVAGSRVWPEIIRRYNVEVRDIQDADHSFSSPECRREMFEFTLSCAARIRQ